MYEAHLLLPVDGRSWSAKCMKRGLLVESIFKVLNSAYQLWGDTWCPFEPHTSGHVACKCCEWFVSVQLHCQAFLGVLLSLGRTGQT